jgi:hypothetical protein
MASSGVRMEAMMLRIVVVIPLFIQLMMDYVRVSSVYAHRCERCTFFPPFLVLCYVLSPFTCSHSPRLLCATPSPTLWPAGMASTAVHAMVLRTIRPMRDTTLTHSYLLAPTFFTTLYERFAPRIPARALYPYCLHLIILVVKPHPPSPTHPHHTLISISLYSGDPRI